MAEMYILPLSHCPLKVLAQIGMGYSASAISTSFDKRMSILKKRTRNIAPCNMGTEVGVSGVEMIQPASGVRSRP
jgi:hypothetical protein